MAAEKASSEPAVPSAAGRHWDGRLTARL